MWMTPLGWWHFWHSFTLTVSVSKWPCASVDGCRQATLQGIADDRRIRVAAADENIRGLRQRLSDVTRRGQELRTEMHELQQATMTTRAKLEKYHVKATVMDRTRDKGYVVDSKAVRLFTYKIFFGPCGLAFTSAAEPEVDKGWVGPWVVLGCGESCQGNILLSWSNWIN